MNLNEYQFEASLTAIYPKEVGLAYVTMGLAGEAGEIANKVKKIYRDAGGELTDEKRKELKSELGDVLWYLAQVAEEVGVDLNSVARENLVKLNQRRLRGTLSGSGDSR